MIDLSKTPNYEDGSKTRFKLSKQFSKPIGIYGRFYRLHIWAETDSYC